MLRRSVGTASLLLVVAATLFAHDMFLKLDTYFLQPNAPAAVPLLNGTFSVSENAIARARIADISLADPGGRARFDTTVVSARNDTTFFALQTGGPGTAVIGVSTRPNTIEMTGEAFHQYLNEEGLSHVIAERQRAGVAAAPVKERYAKHVKAVVQVGEARTASFGTVLGYPAELVPLDNPYEFRRGGALRFRCQVNGQPAAGLTVISGGRTPSGGRIERRELKADTDGVVALRPSGPGRWYLTFIHIGAVTAPDHNYASEWATITFQLR